MAVTITTADYIRGAFGVVLAFGLAYRGLKKKSLSPAGAAAAFLV
eukprot:CAMPEP_0198363212 /NCGR_PEP_ID=MMETSP1450-20131203/148951_1 /TAXON_ID=753684 ORGANISM="Madagascaria erythrocladiodes, Strain CCMP3234" /NCGR_SAMPLE_ID=MMETSP1450 /ASSEMBLY_ACC=CAM_ASM_001115 /LENGTH=44 /DNA_ID= /DNA_START= /DNA_END= /DNA_ORIENTATION=